MVIILFFLAHWYLSLFCQTFFQHRYAAHQAFTMSKGWERFFYILTFISQGSSFISPRAYAIMHRLHHAYTDTELDPHSPSYDSNLFTMMWRTKNVYQSILNGKYAVEERFMKNLPDWPFIEKLGDSWMIRLMWAGLYTWFYVAFAPSAWYFLLLPVQFLMSPVHGAIINWFAHKYQYINFKQNNTSRNLLPLDFLMMGEAYHNNHHKFPSRINFGFRWHEIDPTYPVILLLKKVGVIRVARMPAPAKTEMRHLVMEEVH